MLKLRVRLPTGGAPQTIEVLEDSPWIGLLQHLEEISGIEAAKLRVLSGFPPKPLEPDDEALPLKVLGLRQNDTLILQEGEAKVLKSKPGERLVPAAPPLWHFTRREMPADNSCLFHAVAYVLKNKKRGIAQQMREECIQMILSRPDLYNTATLGRDPMQYAAWIYGPNAWGGGIELSAFSLIYKTEIFALDLQSSTVLNFGTDNGYDARVFLVFTGNHYDAIAMNKDYNSFQESTDQVLFKPSDATVLTRAKAFVKEEGEKMRAQLK